jgi:hypothetical protein
VRATGLDQLPDAINEEASPDRPGPLFRADSYVTWLVAGTAALTAALAVTLS